MAGHTSRSGGKSKRGGVQNPEVGMFSGVVVRDSFSIVGTLRAEAGFTLYKTRFKLTVRNSEGYHMTEEHEVLKRFSDFQGLSKQLELVHAQSSSTMKFPTLVKAKYFERFKETVIQERKKSAEELLNFVSCYPHLSQSSHFHIFIAGSKRVNTVAPSPPANSHLPVASDNLNLTPSPMSHAHQHKPEEATLSPDVTIKEEEGLSVGFVVSRTPGDSIQLPKKDSTDNPASPLTSSNLEPNPDALAPLLDTSAVSGGSSAGSNVSLEILEVDSSLVSPKPEAKSDKSDSSSSSFSEEELEVPLDPKESSPGEAKQEEMSGASGSQRGGGGGGGGEMSWWTSAMAEADNVGDDLDALIDKVEESTPKTKRSSMGKQRQGSFGHRSHSNPGSHHGSRHSSRHSSHQGSPVQQRRVSPSAQRESAYAVQAGRLIAQALEYESFGDYEEAFDLMKAGVDVLLNGVQTDQNKERREVVRRKTSEYLLYAENLQKKLSTMNSVKTDAAASSSEQESAVSKDPTVPAPAPAKPHHLQDFTVKQIFGKVMLVESRHTRQQYIFKVLHKSLKAMAAIPRGMSKVTKNRAPMQSPYIVKLLHFYETPNHRIFLLLEYIKKGRLLDYVASKREQWRKLKEAATNPPPSSSLLSSNTESSRGIMKKEAKEVAVEDLGVGDRGSIDRIEEKNEGSENLGRDSAAKEKEDKDEQDADKSGSSDDSEMEKMLSELTSIVPPKSLPPESSITSQQTVSSECLSEENNSDESLDTLALMRKRLEESMQETDSACPVRTGKDLTIELSKTPEDRVEKEEEEEEDVIDTTIRVLPPTPTVAKGAVGNGEIMTSFPASPMDSLVVGATDDVAVGAKNWDSGSSMQVSLTDSGRKGSTGQGPVFTPSSLQNSDLSRVDDWSQRLEQNVKRWAAQIVLALEHLHNQNVICRDLHPNNVLINDSGDAVLTYFGKWDFVDDKEDIELAKKFYMAPELMSLSQPSVAVDWWCLGIFLFELLTGKCLTSCLPGGTHSHLPLPLPVPLSSEAKSLLTQLLQISPAERLGSGPAGVEEVKAHPFFAGINWRKP